MPPSPTAFAGARVLTGPTGAGKSAAALEIAERIGGEVVAMDSMTLYRGMDVGTAKPTPADRARVPHHLLDVLDPWESANVAWWLDRAAAVCTDIRARGKVPIFVGGTPFYLKSLLFGLFAAPPASAEIRPRLESEAAADGPASLHARLAAADPVAARRLHPNDVRRVVRALEVWELTGRPLSSFQQTWDTANFAGGTAPPPPAVPCVAVEWPRDQLVARIDARTDAMLAAGWLDEADRLRKLPHPPGPEARQAVGYRELWDVLDGRLAWADAVERIRVRTRQLAKRQETWFRSLGGTVRVAGGSADLAGDVLRAWGETAGKNPPGGSDCTGGVL